MVVGQRMKTWQVRHYYYQTLSPHTTVCPIISMCYFKTLCLHGEIDQMSRGGLYPFLSLPLLSLYTPLFGFSDKSDLIPFHGELVQYVHSNDNSGLNT